MSDELVRGPEQSPTVEVRVFRDGAMVATELCDSEEEAAAVVERWSEVAGVTTEVDDLAVRHRPEDVLAPQPAEPVDEDYPHDVGDVAERY